MEKACKTVEGSEQAIVQVDNATYLGFGLEIPDLDLVCNTIFCMDFNLVQILNMRFLLRSRAV